MTTISKDLFRAVLCLLMTMGMEAAGSSNAAADEARPFVIAAPEVRRPIDPARRQDFIARQDIPWEDRDVPAAPLPLPGSESSENPPVRAFQESKPLADIDFADAFVPWDQLSTGDSQRPELVPVDRDPYWGSQDRMTYCWEARNLAHRTLYFDDMPAERLGIVQILPLQPFASGLDFVRDFAILPFRWPHDRSHELHYVLGLNRPGTCATHVRERWLTHY